MSSVQRQPAQLTRALEAVLSLKACTVLAGMLSAHFIAAHEAVPHALAVVFGCPVVLCQHARLLHHRAS